MTVLLRNPASANTMPSFGHDWRERRRKGTAVRPSWTSVSTSIWRFTPLVFFPPSNPRIPPVSLAFEKVFLGVLHSNSTD